LQFSALVSRPSFARKSLCEIKKAIDTKKLDLGKYFDSDDFKKILEDKYKKYKARAGDLALDEISWQTKYKTLYKIEI
jgi:hypothetical protein